jgi:hypothetical protein
LTIFALMNSEKLFGYIRGLKNHSIQFELRDICEGDSEEEFVNYIAGLDFYEISSELDEETANELDKFYDMVDWEEWYNSAWDGEENWIEIGESDPEYRRTGGFNARYTTGN